jgi:hypothetical protein
LRFFHVDTASIVRGFTKAIITIIYGCALVIASNDVNFFDLVVPNSTGPLGMGV